MSIEKTQANLMQFLAAQKKQIAAALPKHLTPDRMLRIVMTEIRKVPKLRECDPVSLVGAVIQCSQLGLEPGSSLGHAYLIPYGKECQFIIGYRGMIDLNYRSSKVLSIEAHVVKTGDIFEFEYGTNKYLKHVPGKERGELTHAYVIAYLATGGYQFEVLARSDIDKIRSRSKAAKSGPWVTDYEAMAKKTAVRQIFKYLPASVEMLKAIQLDEAAERGEQYNSLIIEGELEIPEVTSQAAETQTKEAQTKNDSRAEEIAKEFFGE